MPEVPETNTESVKVVESGKGALALMSESPETAVCPAAPPMVHPMRRMPPTCCTPLTTIPMYLPVPATAPAVGASNVVARAWLLLRKMLMVSGRERFPAPSLAVPTTRICPPDPANWAAGTVMVSVADCTCPVKPVSSVATYPTLNESRMLSRATLSEAVTVKVRPAATVWVSDLGVVLLGVVRVIRGAT